eukprot:250590-Chlamydomonas_euryale.AAC.4
MRDVVGRVSECACEGGTGVRVRVSDGWASGVGAEGEGGGWHAGSEWQFWDALWGLGFPRVLSPN